MRRFIVDFSAIFVMFLKLNKIESKYERVSLSSCNSIPFVILAFELSVCLKHTNSTLTDLMKPHAR